MTGNPDATNSTHELDTGAVKDFLEAEGNEALDDLDELDEELDNGLDDEDELDGESDDEENESDDEDELDGESDDEENESDGSKASTQPADSTPAKTGEDANAGTTSATSTEPSLEEELKTGIKPDFIPGSKEFFQATAAEAKALIAKEFGEFDEYDPEHIARFNYFVNEVQANRKAEYQAAVEIIKNQREQRAVQKQQIAIQKQLDVEMNRILSTPELKKRFGSLLKNMETNSRGDYLVLLEELHQGKTDRLIGLAKKVAGPHGRILDRGAGKVREHPTKPAKATQHKRSNDGLMTAADLGFL